MGLNRDNGKENGNYYLEFRVQGQVSYRWLGREKTMEPTFWGSIPSIPLPTRGRA